MAKFDVECDSCGSPLSADLQAIERQVVLMVEPCKKCREKDREAGYAYGEEAGADNKAKEA